MDKKLHLSAKTMRKHPPRLYFNKALNADVTTVYYDQYYLLKAGDVIKLNVEGEDRYKYEVFLYTNKGIRKAVSKKDYSSIDDALNVMSSMFGKLPQFMHPDVYELYKKAIKI